MSLKATAAPSPGLDRNGERYLWERTIQSGIRSRWRIIVTEVLRRPGDEFPPGCQFQLTVSESRLMWVRTRSWILWIEVLDQKSQ